MKNYKINTRFVRPERPKARANKTGIDYNNFYFSIQGKLSLIRCYT